MRRLLIAALLWAGPSVAWAQCAEPYPRESFESALVTIGGAVRTGEVESANELLHQVGERLVCTPGQVDRTLLATYARWTSLVAFFDQDETAATRWALASRYADPDLAWPEWLPPTHPFRGMAVAAEDPPIGTVPDKALLAPRGGGVLLSGRLVLEPRARAEVPVFVQVLDKKAVVTRAYWQDGSAFPDDMLTASTGEPLPPPKWWSEEVPALTPVEPVAHTKAPKAERPDHGGGAPVGAIVLAIGSAVAGGALYGVATLTAQDLPNAADTAEAVALRTRANALVVASGAAAATSLGATIGAIAAQGAGVGFTVRF